MAKSGVSSPVLPNQNGEARIEDKGVRYKIHRRQGPPQQYEMACDFSTHVLCHRCALCQEGREARCRLPHPGFNARLAIPVMIPPTGQTMGGPA